jgi:peptidoglycan/xylan/chitin deacetylase (PgdA/CDA1 family)
VALDIYLKGYPHPAARKYLSEGDLEMKFSALQKLYYRVARPLLPIPIRQWLQGHYAGAKRCLSNFIWPDLVDLLKEDDEAWDAFVRSLYPQGYQCAVVLTHDVETQEGYDFIPEVVALERKYGIRSSWNVVPYKYSLHREILELLNDNGFEIGIHGYNHDGTCYFSERRFQTRAGHINQAIREYGAVGFRSPQVHRDLRWLQYLEISYDASCFDYDPYQPFPGGTGCIWPFMAGKFVELPYTLPQDHVLFYMLGESDISIWKEKCSWLVANHGMVLVLTHPDYLREGNHLRMYEELLVYLKEIPNAWHCLPREMATWYRDGIAT